MKRMSNTQLSTSLRAPSSFYGMGLKPSEEKLFLRLKNRYANVISLDSREEVAALVNISDCVDAILGFKQTNALNVLTVFFDYLRAKLLSEDRRKIRAAALVVDTFIKNASTYKDNSHYIYHLSGSERFLKTLCRRARELTTTAVPTEMVLTGRLLLDCIQAWGEAFSTPDRKYVYGFYKEYMALRDKHHALFPRVEYDPERVPIFLGELSSAERDFHREHSGITQEEQKQDDIAHSLGVTDTEELGVEAKPTVEATADLLDFGEADEKDSAALTLRPPSGSDDAQDLPSWFTDQENKTADGQLVLYPYNAMTIALPGTDLHLHQQQIQQQREHYQQMQDQQQYAPQYHNTQQYLQQRYQPQLHSHAQSAWQSWPGTASPDAAGAVPGYNPPPPPKIFSTREVEEKQIKKHEDEMNSLGKEIHDDMNSLEKMVGNMFAQQQSCPTTRPVVMASVPAPELVSVDSLQQVHDDLNIRSRSDSIDETDLFGDECELPPAGPPCTPLSTATDSDADTSLCINPPSLPMHDSSCEQSGHSNRNNSINASAPATRVDIRFVGGNRVISTPKNTACITRSKE